MKTGGQAINERIWKRPNEFVISVSLILLVACLLIVFAQPKNGSHANKDGEAPVVAIEPLAFVLAPQTGDSRTDREIRRLQEKVRDANNPELVLEQLGWAFVSKARESFDAGFYRLAEQCAQCIEKMNPQSQAAMLLRGHVLHNLHRFKESEALARRLVEQRGLGFDYGLLGDVLMEQGRLSEAVVAYQQMMNLKPDLQAYARAAHIRWLKGDLAGAIEAMRLAVGATTPLDPESAAWVNTRLAAYEFQAGRFAEAEQRCALALSFQSNYAPALLLRGKMLLTQDKFEAAITDLRTAAKFNPLPEYQWALADALRAGPHCESEASAIEAELQQHGAASDPRTFAVFLATRHQSPDTALRLAKTEFDSRSDVFTHDAFAWSLAAAGKLTEARSEMERALAEGTEDGRLFFHAAVIASQTGDAAATRRWLDKATNLSHVLLPSERGELESLSARRANENLSVAPKTGKPFSLSKTSERKSQTPNPQT
ncbi:MAG TPA: tetratricopeptide repeat protein [Chthoniobacterales bacterium]|nr:tetratricopeptide repeat protein [Chthoniobacterales bacterium]